ncbi:MAG: hypothetical protein LBH80_05305 [Prevotellaceae bacterium]|jgi:hypothetical protein|nr:hypothetical protein [Prevotellaceae bacterium]
MKKTKFEIEYPLNTRSSTVLWDTISCASGLSEWFADDVNAVENDYIFSWKKYTQKACLIKMKPNVLIRFRWEEDKDTDCFFEIKITCSELEGNLSLLITDYAEDDEIDDAILLWDKHVEVLKRKIGI